MLRFHTTGELWWNSNEATIFPWIFPGNSAVTDSGFVVVAITAAVAVVVVVVVDDGIVV